MPYVEFHTSGSTGTPKVIRKTEAQMQADVDVLVRNFSTLFEGKPRLVATINPEHLYGQLWCTRLPKALGYTQPPRIIIAPEELFEEVLTPGPITFVSTPSFLRNLLEREECTSLRGRLQAIITSGALLTEELSERIYQTTGTSPTEIFGSTETGSIAYRRQAEDKIWRVLKGVSVSQDPNGCLVVDSPFCITRPYVMSDAVELLAPERFRLLGRTDRCVKVLEQMVSLPAIEQALEQHPYVASAHALPSSDPITRIWSLVKLTPEGKQALKHSTYANTIRQINKSLNNIIPSFAHPRRMRFVENFPTNTQGKLLRSTILPLLESPSQEPVIENLRITKVEISATVTWPSDSLCFNGHFPNFPILPGVIQLDTTRQLLERYFSLPSFYGTVSRLKFTKPIRPLEEVQISIKRIAPLLIEFTFETNGERASSGRLEYPQ